MDEMFKKIQEIGFVPVIKIDNPKDAVPLAKALCKGGLPAAEITFRTDAALESIKAIKENVPEILLGAGTVLSVEQADTAIDAGASFIVSPGLNQDVVKRCQHRNVAILPGCVTPTEIERALSLGLDTLKFFPAEQAGGLNYIKAVCGPYTSVKFIPTGGISLKNLENYLGFNKILACGGSFMATGEMIKENKWEEISEICRQTAEIVKKARGN